MSWIVNIAGKAEDFLNKIDQSTAVALQTGDPASPSSSRSNSRSKRKEFKLEFSEILPTLNDGKTSQLSLTTTNDGFGPKSTTATSVAAQVMDLEANGGFGRGHSRPKPPRPSKLRNSNSATSLSNSNEIQDNGPTGRKQKESITSCGTTDEQLFNFLNSPSQELDESSLLKNEIASQSREMTHILKNYKKLQQEHEALKKSYEVITTLQNEKSNDCRNDNSSNSKHVTHEDSILDFTTSTALNYENYEMRLIEKNEEIGKLQTQLNSVLDRFETNEKTQSMQNRVAQIELENQRVKSENEEITSKLASLTAQLETSGRNVGIIKDRLVTVEKEYSSYKDKAKSILKSKDELIANMSSTNSTNLQGEHIQPNALPASASQQPNEFQFLSEIGSLRSERELLHAEITQNRFYSDALREENNRLETELQSLRVSNANLHSFFSKEKQTRHNHQEENLQLSQQISTLQLDFERERIEKLKLVEKLEKYDSSNKTAGNNMRKSNSLNDFDVNQSQFGLNSDFDETETLRTRITALSQSLLEKQNYINAISADKQLLQLRVERLQTKVQEMNNEVEYHQNDDSFNFGSDGLTTDSVVSSQPLYLSESPWDSKIARRVKRAYAHVDTLCCQIGLILRQRPNIRLGFCTYILCLHLWVFFVLFSWSHNHSPDPDVK